MVPWYLVVLWYSVAPWWHRGSTVVVPWYLVVPYGTAVQCGTVWYRGTCGIVAQCGTVVVQWWYRGFTLYITVWYRGVSRGTVVLWCRCTVWYRGGTVVVPLYSVVPRWYCTTGTVVLWYSGYITLVTLH